MAQLLLLARRRILRIAPLYILTVIGAIAIGYLVFNDVCSWYDFCLAMVGLSCWRPLHAQCASWLTPYSILFQCMLVVFMGITVLGVLWRRVGRVLYLSGVPRAMRFIVGQKRSGFVYILSASFIGAAILLNVTYFLSCATILVVLTKQQVRAASSLPSILPNAVCFTPAVTHTSYLHSTFMSFSVRAPCFFIGAAFGVCTLGMPSTPDIFQFNFIAVVQVEERSSRHEATPGR